MLKYDKIFVKFTNLGKIMLLFVCLIYILQMDKTNQGRITICNPFFVSNKEYSVFKYYKNCKISLNNV